MEKKIFVLVTINFTEGETHYEQFATKKDAQKAMKEAFMDDAMDDEDWEDYSSIEDDFAEYQIGSEWVRYEIKEFAL